MQDQLSEILFYVKGTLKYKWVIIIVAWLIGVGGWVFVSNMPDEYQSIATVNVDSRSQLQPLLGRMTVRSNTRGLVSIMQQLMFTRPKLERVAQLANLELDSKSEAGKLSLISKLKNGIQIQGKGNDLFSISYDGDEAKEAQNIVHAVLTVFSEQTQARGIADRRSAQQFIEGQISEYEVRLRNAEKARENFRRVNSGLLPGQGEGGLGSLSTLQALLQEANMTLSEINSQEGVIHDQIEEALEAEGENEDEWGLGDIEESHVSTPEDAKIAVLQEHINEMLIRYTENYPDVISLKLQIKGLQERRLETLANMPEEQSLMGSIGNPYVQALKMSLNQIETEKASTLSRIGILNNRMTEVQKSMDASLRIETALQNLDRDYSVIKGNYMNLIRSRETAALTEAADRSQGVLKFKIVDAPTAPLNPTGPNRKLFNSAFLGGGIVIGLALAFLIYFIRPTFMSTYQLRLTSGLPVLGSVAMQRHKGNKSEIGYNIFFWFMVVSLLLAYMIVMSIV